MKIGYIGLGKMGSNMVSRLLEKGHTVHVWNRSPEPRIKAVERGAHGHETVESLVTTITDPSTPRVIWLMLPAGAVTHDMIVTLSTQLSPGDILIDGSNNHFEQTRAHATLLHDLDIIFFDAGISGGPRGARDGACVMAGGDAEHVSVVESLFTDIAAPNAYTFFPGNGAGHYVKMVHNGIEYGMMQAIAEGFAVLKSSPYALDLHAVASLYNQKSVIESRLIGWLTEAYAAHNPDLSEMSSTVAHSGEGLWTVETARALGVPVPIIEQSLQFRIDSSARPSYAGRVLTALRGAFGGHKTK